MAEYIVTVRVEKPEKKNIVVKTYQPSVAEAEADAKRKHPNGEIVSIDRKREE